MIVGAALRGRPSLLLATRGGHGGPPLQSVPELLHDGD